MPANSQYPSSQFAVVEIIFRGLYAALMLDPALEGSLVMYLPYYVLYEGDTEHYRVILIHPEQVLGIKFPQTGQARQFLKDNEKLIVKAMGDGRDHRSISHRRVSQMPYPNEPKQGGYIDQGMRGRIQYRILKQMANNPGEINSGVISDEIEYNIDNSFPNVYPVVGILRQQSEAQQHGKIIGIVSMDFEDRLSEKVEAVFNSYMEPFNALNVWGFPPGKTILKYFKETEMEQTPYHAEGKNGLEFHDPPVDPPFDFSDRLKPLKKILTYREYALLETYLDRIQEYVSDKKTAAVRKHRLLRALHDSRTIDTLFLLLAVETVRDTPEWKRDVWIKEEIKSTKNYKLASSVNRNDAKAFTRSLVELMEKWLPRRLRLVEHDRDVAYYVEFRQPRVDAEKLYRNLLKPVSPGDGNFRGALWKLAEASARVGEDLTGVPEFKRFRKFVDFREALEVSDPDTAILACIHPSSDGTILQLFVRGNFEPE